MINRTTLRIALALAFALSACSARARAGGEPAARAVQFNRDIRPILAENCYACHGPDAAKRKAHLRLDTEEGSIADLDGRHAVVPGRPEESELVLRITSKDDEERMPPAKSGRKLSKQQVDLLREWVAQGAKWQAHWSLISPVRPAMPKVAKSDWVKNPIDAFVLAQLEREGLEPAAEAEKTTLIRRATLDLTGLPPTPEEVDAFFADTTDDAYEKVVDRLLASPRYGERMAIRWLEAARYADTNGYQSDGERFMWRWRDWVIDAFNKNMPFDQFTIEQLAGDLLPNATLDQQIATGFNRNHRGNAEGGIIPEEYAVEYVADRVETTSTVWLGLTIGCARCHDHKFDPITQREFYNLFAFFNNVPENGKAVKYGNSPPMIKAPTREQRVEREKLDGQVAAAQRRLADLEPAIASGQATWEHALEPAPPLDWSPGEGLVAHFPLDGSTRNMLEEKAETHFAAGGPSYQAGAIEEAAAFDGRAFVDAGNVGAFGFYDRFSLAAWIHPEGSAGGAIVSRTVETPRGDGYTVALEGGRIQVDLVKRWLDDAIRVETEQTVAPGRWTHVLVTYDGTRLASGVKVYLDGQPQTTRVLLDELNQSFQSTEPLRIGSGGGPASWFVGAIDDVRVYDHALAPEDAAVMATRDSIRAIVARPPGERTPAQAQKLRAWFLAAAAPESIRQARADLARLRKARDELEERITTTMVMAERAEPRETHVLLRGQYDRPGERVTPSVPASLPPLPADLPRNRLGLARWLVDARHPLTARVMVNRLWQMHFGAGLVRTVDDFGTQGDWLAQLELLDWLATELVARGWNVKAIERTIVTSATYRQASRASATLLQRDPDNRLLARGPRLRLPAEVVRDQALAISGLLVEKLGGPSVHPYQPEGLWKDLAEVKEYPRDHGSDLHRRSLYTFWKRTVAPPEMATFDAPGRETCTVRTTRTNTPLQALTLLNDVTFVEAARKLAERMMTQGGTAPEERIALGFRLATARRPTARETEVLLSNLRAQLAHYRHDSAAAKKLLSAGEAPRNERLDACELAAYTAVANLILNLDETITRE